MNHKPPTSVPVVSESSCSSEPTPAALASETEASKTSAEPLLRSLASTLPSPTPSPDLWVQRFAAEAPGLFEICRHEEDAFIASQACKSLVVEGAHADDNAYVSMAQTIVSDRCFQTDDKKVASIFCQTGHTIAEMFSEEFDRKLYADRGCTIDNDFLCGESVQTAIKNGDSFTIWERLKSLCSMRKTSNAIMPSYCKTLEANQNYDESTFEQLRPSLQNFEDDFYSSSGIIEIKN